MRKLLFAAVAALGLAVGGFSPVGGLDIEPTRLEGHKGPTASPNGTITPDSGNTPSGTHHSPTSSHVVTIGAITQPVFPSDEQAADWSMTFPYEVKEDAPVQVQISPVTDGSNAYVVEINWQKESEIILGFPSVEDGEYQAKFKSKVTTASAKYHLKPEIPLNSNPSYFSNSEIKMTLQVSPVRLKTTSAVTGWVSATNGTWEMLKPGADDYPGEFSNTNPVEVSQSEVAFPGIIGLADETLLEFEFSNKTWVKLMCNGRNVPLPADPLKVLSKLKSWQFKRKIELSELKQTG